MKAGRYFFASTPLAALLLIAIAVATRIVSWWNPVAHLDDQFYLLAGEELLRGSWPYIDVWDRKPLGLFLLYAAIAWVFDGSVLGLNLVATGFAAATAMVIRQIGLRFASPTGATLAAITYLVVLPLYGGQNGQSPVFYNLLMAGGAWLMFRASDHNDLAAIRRCAIGAMVLCGLSMTIKQVTFVEGGFFGLSFLWLLRRQGSSWTALVLTAAAMVVVALLPTGLAAAGYAAASEAALNEFIYANFISIFQRRSWSAVARLAGIALLFLYLFPLFIMSAIGAVHQWRKAGESASTRLLLGWLAAAILGYLSVPAFFDHYALPLIPPLVVVAAIFFDQRPGPLFFAAYMLFCLIEGSILDLTGNRREAATYERIRHSVEEARHGGCLFIADGPARLYSDFSGCRPTRYLFADHLVLITEADAVGVDTTSELTRIFSTRPEVVVTRVAPEGRQLPAVRELIRSRLSAQYHPVLRTPPGLSPSVDGVTVWQRNDLSQPKH